MAHDPNLDYFDYEDREIADSFSAVSEFDDENFSEFCRELTAQVDGAVTPSQGSASSGGDGNIISHNLVENPLNKGDGSPGAAKSPFKPPLYVGSDDESEPPIITVREPSNDFCTDYKKGPDGRYPASKMFFFTWNNYGNNHLKKEFKDLLMKCDKYAIQEEICPETGTPHLQGCLWFTKKCRPLDNPFLWQNHVYIRKVKSWNASVAYCTKQETRKLNGMRWIKGIQEPVRKVSVDTLRPWQRRIYDICLEEPDERKIYWFWENTGNVGKSYLTKCLVDNLGAIVVSGKVNDIMFAIASIDKRKKPIPKVCILDIPRANKNGCAFAALENLKNGCFFSGKFESQMVRINPPHVMVFCNFPPDQATLKELSKDRWKVQELTEVLTSLR